MDTENTVEQRIADLEAKCVTIKELHDAATDERDALRVKVSDLERAAVKRREISDGVEAELVDECDTLRTLKRMAESERDALRARLAEIEAQEPAMYVIRSTAKRPQPAVVTQKKYLSCAISDLVDMGLEHLDPLFTRPVPAQAVPDGWRLVQVKSAEFDSLVYWLGRCEGKGHLENCPDLIEPWENFDYRDVAAAPEHKA